MQDSLSTVHQAKNDMTEQVPSAERLCSHACLVGERGEELKRKRKRCRVLNELLYETLGME